MATDSMGARLRQAREMKEWSLSRLSGECGVTKAYIVRLEGGKNSNPTLGLVEKLATALHVSPAWLAFGGKR